MIRDLGEGEAWVKVQRQLFAQPGLILLTGPMGVGKTQLVRWILKALSSDEVHSPTFAIHHRYDTPSILVDHLDLYRLESDQELENTGAWEHIMAADHLTLVEWADRLPLDVYPIARRRVLIQLDRLVTDERVLRCTVFPPGSPIF